MAKKLENDAEKAPSETVETVTIFPAYPGGWADRETVTVGKGLTRRSGEKFDARQTCYFTPTMLEELKNRADQEGRDVSDIIRGLVGKYLEGSSQGQAKVTVRVPLIALKPERLKGSREEGIEGAIELGQGVLALLDVRPGSFFVHLEDHFMALIADLPGDSYVLFSPVRPMQKPKLGDVVLVTWRCPNDVIEILPGADPLLDMAIVIKWAGEADNVPLLKSLDGKGDSGMFHSAVDLEVIAIGRGMISGW